MTCANQTPGVHKFTPLVASQQERANQHEPACFGLSSPWSFPSRSGIPLHAVVQPCFLCRDPFCHEMFRSLSCRSAPFPLVLGCSRPHWSALMPKSASLILQMDCLQVGAVFLIVAKLVAVVAIYVTEVPPRRLLGDATSRDTS